MATTELKDFREEAEEKRQVMQETLTEQEREIEFLSLVMKTLLKETELQNLRERARYDENNQRWVLPVFYVKDKAVQLPKLGQRNQEALVQAELDKRDFIVENRTLNTVSDDEDDATSTNNYNYKNQSQRDNGMNETYYNNGAN